MSADARARGDALARQGRLEDAAACYRQALALNPDDATAAYNLGVVLRDLGRWGEAEHHFRHVLALNPASAEAHNNLGLVVHKQGRPQEASAHYRHALALKPDHARAHYNLGSALAETGELDEAAQAYRRALDLKPDHVRALYSLVQLGNLGADTPGGEAVFALLQEQLADIDRLDAEARSLLLFAAGAVHEARGDYDRAFDYLSEGNAIERARAPFDIDAAERRLGAIPGLFDKPLFERLRGAGDPSERPVFVVGMARSGTTLVEQILSAHPEVHGAGEIPHVAALAQRLADRHTGARWTEALAAADCAAFGRDYLDALPPPPGKRRTTDKTLFNLEHLGLIHLALPNARIVVCRRDPRDVCVSCFASRFGDGQGYANDLGDLARYWRAYDALVAHWRETLPADRLIEVRYEDLVADVEVGARRLTAHCGLAWDPACLDFHLSKRAVRTASLAQVRRPIYASSVGRWRRFEGRLGALEGVLGDR